MTVRILIGDVREKLAELPADSVHMVVTSPPYWGLRDYGVAGQLGMEPTLGEHIETMVEVFREVRRVLRPDGTCWLNYGDCYAGGGGFSPGAPSSAFSKSGKYGDALKEGGIKPQGTLKAKDLCMIPNRLAIALQDDGWWVRSEIIWHKPNPMPESVTDRPAASHEKIWLLTKSARYFYDYESVRTPMKYTGLNGQDESGFKDPRQFNGKHKDGYRTGGKKDKQRGHSRRHAGFNDRWDAMSREEQQSNGANLRNVWTVPTKGFSEAHFATFPPDLIVPCIKAGCPADGTVLDPFGGAGTTALVADRLGRDCILIELNPEYAEMARRRIDDDAGLFSTVEAAE